MLQRGPEDPRRAADIVVRQAHELERLINDLLDAAHLGADRLVLERDRVDLNAVTRDVVECTHLE